MSRPVFSRYLLLAVSSALLAVSPVRAVTIPEFFWAGTQPFDGSWTESTNWVGGVAPLDMDPPWIVFGPTLNQHIDYDTAEAYGLKFLGNIRPYELHGDGAGLAIGAGGIVYSPSGPVQSEIMDDVLLRANQTWTINHGALRVEYGIRDDDFATEQVESYTLTKEGAGNLILQNYESDPNLWTGGLQFNAGRITLFANADPYSYVPQPTASLGVGTITFGPATGSLAPTLTAVGGYEGYYGYDDQMPVVVANEISVNGQLTTEAHAPLYLLGDVKLNANSTITHSGAPLHLRGSISDGQGDPFKLTIDAEGAVVLDPQASGDFYEGTSDEGINTYRGGTHVAKGVLIFANATAVPESGSLSATNRGYIGFADSDNEQAGFLGKFDRANTQGTIGFDTDPSSFYGETTNITTTINLDGFHAEAKLGSATRAILSNTIVPQGQDYRFGGGGGWLQVDSALVDVGGESAVRVESPSELPLTLRLTSDSNSFSGGLYVSNSGVVFADNALPTQIIASNWNVGPGAYVGTESINTSGEDAAIDQTAEINAFIVRFSPDNTNAIVGFDGTDGIQRHIIGDVDLSGMNGPTYIGTNTHGNGDGNSYAGVILGGEITTANDGTDSYRFAGYKGGWLQVDSVLSGETKQVYIGMPGVGATFGDYNAEEYSTVQLTGNNSYGGTTTLYGGQLVVGQSNGFDPENSEFSPIGITPTTALGTGALVVQPHGVTFPGHTGTDDLMAMLAVEHSGTIIPNAVQLEADLGVGGYNNFTLDGVVTGSGGISVEDNIQLKLTKNNTFEGGIYVRGGGSLVLESDGSAGKGALSFGAAASPYVYFLSASPVVHGLGSRVTDGEYADFANLMFRESNAHFNVTQDTDSSFAGAIRADFGRNVSHNDALRFVKSGTGTLNLTDGGLYYHHGTIENTLGTPEARPEVALEVKQGTLVLGSGFYIEDSAPHVWINGGTLVLDDQRGLSNPLIMSSGTLAGSGWISTVTIGAGSTIAPGYATSGNIGNFTIPHLTLAGGGIYEWHIKDPNALEGSADHLDINTPATLEIVASQGNEFIIRPVTLDSSGVNGIMGGIEGGMSYSWALISYDAVSNADLAALALDTSMFQTGYEGMFSLAFVAGEGSSGTLMLNFTAIPEPSTYVLLALGLGFVAVTAWRKRRA